MLKSRRSFLRLIGIGAGAAVAAPVLAMVPTQPSVNIDDMAALYHRNIQEDLLNRIRAGMYEELEHSNFRTATADQACAGTESNKFITPRMVKQMIDQLAVS